MQFGGHETFTLREGWLHKGLSLVSSDSNAFNDEFVADVLGVGRNMAKSIRHWLVATGVARESEGSLKPTRLGELVLKYDPYFVSATTWWLLHAELVGNSESAFTWNWFFSQFHADRFERPSALEALKRHVAFARTRPPKPETLSRDLNCMLACYSRALPVTQDDPEDTKLSPLINLGLLDQFTESGQYRRNRGPKAIHDSVFAYAIVRAYERRGEAVPTTVTLNDLSRLDCGPVSVFSLGMDALHETIDASFNASDDPVIRISGLAGQRTLQLSQTSSLQLIKRALKHSQEEQHVS